MPRKLLRVSGATHVQIGDCIGSKGIGSHVQIYRTPPPTYISFFEMIRILLKGTDVHL